jgi:hypothetical protein
MSCSRYTGHILRLTAILAALAAVRAVGLARAKVTEPRSASA